MGRYFGGFRDATFLLLIVHLYNNIIQIYREIYIVDVVEYDLSYRLFLNVIIKRDIKVSVAL
jgi:hypothetical protein